MHNVCAYTFWFLQFYISAYTTLNELLAVFLYIIFAVLLKFERSLNSYLICTTTTTTTKLSSSRHQCKISLTYVNWPENPLQMQKSCRYFLQRPSYSQFLLQISLSWQRRSVSKNAIGNIAFNGPSLKTPL